MNSMPTKNVKIGTDIYKLTAVTTDISGAISIELLSDLAPLIVAVIEGNVPDINRELRTSINAEKLMRMTKELINPNLLEKNGDLIPDWKGEFACKPLTFFKLGFEALRLNCEDFFTFISGIAKEKNIGEGWSETIMNLKKEGVEIPPMFSLLFQTGEQATETTLEN